MTNKFLKVKNKFINLPNDRMKNIEFVEHNGAVLIIPFLNENEVVMIKQFRPTIEDYLYELPAGTIELGEDAFDCAKRELIEEIGFEAKSWEKLGFIHLCPGYSTEKIFIYKAWDLQENTSIEKDEDECILVEIWNKAKVQKYFQDGKITDAKTISAFVFCGWL